MSTPKITRDVSLLRALFGIIAGAFLGGALTALLFALRDYEGHGRNYFLMYDIRWVWITFVFALGVWAVGLTVVASLPWWLLHKSGLRNWYIAATLGFVLTFMVNLAFYSDAFGLIPAPANSGSKIWDSQGLIEIDNRLTAHGWWISAGESALYGLIGFLVALVVWGVAYRPLPPDSKV